MASPRLARGRFSTPGAVYAITTVTKGRLPVFHRQEPATCVAECIHGSDDAGWTQTHAWVVMPDHVHWLFSLAVGDLSACVRKFKSHSARSINRLVGTQGAIWQAGFFDHRMRDAEDLRAQAMYVIRNPVRAGLVARSVDYPYWGCRWVSHADADRIQGF